MLTYEHQSLRQGLVGAWCPSLGASGLSLIDRSGRNNHGTLVNMAGQDNWRASGSGVALNLDGTNDHAVLAGFVPASIISVSAWVYLKSQPTGGNLAGIFSRWGNNAAFDATDAFTLNIGVGQGFRFFLGGVNAGVTTGSSAVTLLQWTHLAATYNGATITIFVNGIAGGSTAASGSITQSNVEMRIGKDVAASATDKNLDAFCDDVRLYNRALTLAEIRLLASRRGIGLTPLPDRAAGLPKKLFVNDAGTWRDGDAYVNTGSGWRLGVPFVNDAGTWR
jgi:hypothetical protein